MLFSIALLLIEQRDHKLEGLRAALSVIVFPIHYLASLPSDISADVLESGISYHDLLKENQRLKKEQLIHQAKLLKLSTLEKENIRLRALLENSFKLGEQFLIADLLSVNLAAYEHVVLVNKGSRFGVHAKQPVVDADGIVGQIIRANPLTSEIMLITDPSHAIPVQINRNGLRTIAVGSGQTNQLNLPFLPNNADIREGDLLISSGLGEIFPPGYPVATVDTFTPQPDKPFALVTATTSASLDRSREFLIIWSDTHPIPLTHLPDQGPEQTANPPVKTHDQ